MSKARGWEVSAPVTRPGAAGGGEVIFYGNEDRWPGVEVEIGFDRAGNLTTIRVPDRADNPFHGAGRNDCRELDLRLLASPDFAFMVMHARARMSGGLRLLGDMFMSGKADDVDLSDPAVYPAMYAAAYAVAKNKAELHRLVRLAVEYIELCDAVDGHSFSPAEVLRERHHVSKRTVQSWLAKAGDLGLMVRAGERRRGGALTAYGQFVLDRADESD